MTLAELFSARGHPFLLAKVPVGLREVGNDGIGPTLPGRPWCDPAPRVVTARGPGSKTFLALGRLISGRGPAACISELLSSLYRWMGSAGGVPRWADTIQLANRYVRSS